MLSTVLWLGVMLSSEDETPLELTGATEAFVEGPCDDGANSVLL